MPVFGIAQAYCVVRDLDRAIDFYQRVLGFQLVFEVLRATDGELDLGAALPGENWEGLHGVTGRKVAVVQLAGWSLGLIELEEPMPAPATRDHLGIGAMSLALRVSDVEVEREGLESAGVESLSEIQEFEDRTGYIWKWCTFDDPEGNTLALIEDRPVDFDLARMATAVREGRLARNWTLQDLARRVGLSAAHLSQIERGQSFPSVNALLAIARSMGLPPSRFFEGEADHYSSQSDASLRLRGAAPGCDFDDEAVEGLNTPNPAVAGEGAPDQPPAPGRPVTVFVADELQKLADLKDRGVLTEEEFQRQKARLIS